jgi:hypothetical protein
VRTKLPYIGTGMGLEDWAQSTLAYQKNKVNFQKQARNFAPCTPSPMKVLISISEQQIIPQPRVSGEAPVTSQLVQETGKTS